MKIYLILHLLSTVNGSVLPLETSIYILKGIIVHSGISPESGHYYSFLVHNEQWFEFNDQNIRKVDYEYVKQNSFGDGPNTAYFLLYQKEDIDLFFEHDFFN